MKSFGKNIALLLAVMLILSMSSVYAAVPGGGTTVITTEKFMQYAESNSSAAVATKIQGDVGLYSSYMSLNIKSITSSGASRALNYYDLEGTYGMKGSIASGDVLLARIVVRATNEDDSTGELYLAVHDKDQTVSTAKKSFSSLWTEICIPITANTAAHCLNVRMGTKVQSLDIAEFELINYKNTKTVSQLPDTITVLETPPAEGEEQTMINFFEGLEGVTADTGRTDYPLSKTFKEQTYNFTTAQTKDIGKTDTLVFSLVVRAAKSTALTVKFDKYSDKTMTYHVPAQWSELRIIIAGRGLSSLSLSAENDIEIAGAHFEDYNDTPVLTVGQRTGVYLLEEFDYYPLPEQGVGAGPTIDLVKYGNFIYSIGDGQFTVTDVSHTKAPVITDTIGGLGVNIRQIAITDDGTHVMITSRENGAYIINVTDPYHVYVRTVYHSAEMATGIAISGDYAYVCDRHYGVEIVDITDLDHPVQVSEVRAGEVQSCKVVDGVLYCGVWGTRSVEMYDITNPNRPTYLGSASLNGRGDGMSVYKKGGRTYLYAATGHHTWGVSTTDPLTNLHYGQGNGLDIFDVTDPTSPVHLSTSKIDGRYYYSNYDYWEAEVSESKDGHLYVYLVNTFNGVFVYNVDDPAAPVRVAHIDVPIAPTSDNYVYYSSTSRSLVFPYDQKEAGRSPIGACVVEEGKMFLAGVLTDVHIFEQEDLLFEQVEENAGPSEVAPNGSYYTFDGSSLSGYRLFDSVGQINSIRQCGERYFLAAGSEGIIEIDEDMNRRSTTPTQGICFDVAIYGDTLYAAEGDNGLSAYRIEDRGLTYLWTYKTEHGTVRSVTLSPKGRFAVFQAGARYGEIISTETRKNVIDYRSGSQMYYRNISPVIAGRYVFIWGFFSGGGKWYDFGAEDNLAAPELVRTLYPHQIGIHSGHLAEYNGKVLSFASDGYIIYDPADTSVDVTTLPVYKATLDRKFSGFAAIRGDLMVVTDRPYGYMHITDISDITNPVIKKSLYLPGNPDQALITDRYIWVPVGYQGLMRFDLDWENKCGHVAKEQPVVDVAPTCISSGVGHSVCALCGSTLQSGLVLPANGQHTEGTEILVDAKPTCTGTGKGHTECTVCGTTIKENITINSLGGHVPGTLIIESAASCTAAGSGYKECQRCGQVAQDHIEIPKRAHKAGDWKTVKEPTYLEEGLQQQSCVTCGALLNTRPLPKDPGQDVLTIFKDVRAKDWYYKNGALNFAYNMNIFKGVTESTFQPNASVDRGMFVTVLGRLHGVAVDNKVDTPFTDVKRGKYYTGYVKWASDNGIVNGLTATTFGPGAQITREQICAMMTRYCDYAGIKLRDLKAPISFTDAHKISGFAKKAVAACQRGGVVNGISDKEKGTYSFDPRGKATRAEAATILMNFIKNYK